MPNDLPKDRDLEYFVFFDVCLTCDDEKLTKVSNDIWDKYLATEFKVSGRGRRPTTPYNEQFKTLFLNLLFTFHRTPKKVIAISMRKGNYKPSRYNPLNLSDKLIDIVDKSEKVGLIGLKIGIYTTNAKKATRIWPTPLLKDIFEECDVNESLISESEQLSNQYREVILINKKDEMTTNTVLVDYKDTAETNQWRGDVRFYNDVLARHHIDVGTLSDKEYLKEGVANKSVVRIFHRANLKFECGGRLYCAFWESINSRHRENILINGNETIELDYSSLHINIAYGKKGVTPPEGDMYDIGDFDSSIDSKIRRAWIKQMVIVCLNAKTLKGTLIAFDDKLKDSKGVPAKTVWESLDKERKTQLRKTMRDLLIAKHKAIEEFFCADCGVTFMRIDSDITMEVLTHFAKMNVPVLSVHDSYIIDFQRAGMLDEKLHEVFEKRFGFKANIPRGDFGADEALKRLKEFPELDNLDRSDVMNPAFYLPQLPEADRHDDYKKRLNSFRFK
jgi:hypothetical protein